MDSPRDTLPFYLPHQTSLTVKPSGPPCFGLLFPSDRPSWLSSGSPRFTTSLRPRDHSPRSPHGFAHPGASQDVNFGGQGPCAFPSTLLMPRPDPGVRVALSECLREEGPVSYLSLSLNMLPNDTSPLKSFLTFPVSPHGRLALGSDRTWFASQFYHLKAWVILDTLFNLFTSRLLHL